MANVSPWLVSYVYQFIGNGLFFYFNISDNIDVTFVQVCVCLSAPHRMQHFKYILYIILQPWIVFKTFRLNMSTELKPKWSRIYICCGVIHNGRTSMRDASNDSASVYWSTFGAHILEPCHYHYYVYTCQQCAEHSSCVSISVSVPSIPNAFVDCILCIREFHDKLAFQLHSRIYFKIFRYKNVKDDDDDDDKDIPSGIYWFYWMYMHAPNENERAKKGIHVAIQFATICNVILLARNFFSVLFRSVFLLRFPTLWRNVCLAFTHLLP